MKYSQYAKRKGCSIHSLQGTVFAVFRGWRPALAVGKGHHSLASITQGGRDAVFTVYRECLACFRESLALAVGKEHTGLQTCDLNLISNTGGRTSHKYHVFMTTNMARS